MPLDGQTFCRCPTPHPFFEPLLGSGLGMLQPAELLQKLIALGACNSKFGTEGVSVRVVVQQDPKT